MPTGDRRYHELIPLDRLNEALIAKQVRVDQHAKPLLGWALLSFALIDVAGGALGLPVLASSWVLCVSDGGALAVATRWAAVIVQAGMLGSALWLLMQAPPVWSRREGLDIDAMSAAGMIIGTSAALLAFAIDPSAADTSGEQGGTGLWGFRSAEIVLLIGCGLLLRLFALRPPLDIAQSIQVGAPIGREARAIYRFAGAHLTAHPALLRFDTHELAKVLVFQSADSDNYRRLDPAETISLADGEVLVIDLSALQTRIGTGLVRITDSSGVFTMKMELRTESSTWKHFGVTDSGPIPRQLFNALIDYFFDGEGIVSVLEEKAGEALLDFTADLRRQYGWRTARSLYESLEEMCTKIQAQPGLQVKMPGHIGNLMLPIGKMAMLQAAYASGDAMQRFVDTEWRPKWELVRQRKVDAEKRLPELFHQRLLDYLNGKLRLDDSEGLRVAEAAVECSGLTMRVLECEYAAGPAQDCEEFATKVAEQMRMSHEEFTRGIADYLDIQRDLMDAREQERILKVIEKLPQLMPYLQRVGSAEKVKNTIAEILRLGEQHPTLPGELKRAGDPVQAESILLRYGVDTADR